MTARAGVLPVDKPVGPTSHDVVAAARRALRERRIGHTGTLDPFASGLLLLCVGSATRLAEYLTDLPKSYRAVARLGASTETDDHTGAVVATSEEWRTLSPERVREALSRMEGPLLQVPPAYSAKKVAGERMYDRARRGEAVELAPVPVHIYRIEVLSIDLPEVEFEVECSSGTYIRAIARDLGEALGVGGHLAALRRTRIGVHDVSRAVPLAALGEPEAVAAAWIPPAEALAQLPRVEVAEEAAAAIAHGKAVPAPAGGGEGAVVAVTAGGELLAVAEARGGLLHPRKVFPRG
jgi:tRNA pseudouridine55 synthase